VTWDEFHMEMAKTASLKSKDESTKIGAVIVGPDHEIRSTGYNGFPRGALDNVPEGLIKDPMWNMAKKRLANRLERPLKYRWTEHAERNAVYNAARVGIPLKGCTLYVCGLPPCCDCARAIIQSGIIEVVHPDIEVPERWQEDCWVAREMLLECRVRVRKI